MTGENHFGGPAPWEALADAVAGQRREGRAAIGVVVVPTAERDVTSTGEAMVAFRLLFNEAPDSSGLNPGLFAESPFPPVACALIIPVETVGGSVKVRCDGLPGPAVMLFATVDRFRSVRFITAEGSVLPDGGSLVPPDWSGRVFDWMCAAGLHLLSEDSPDIVDIVEWWDRELGGHWGRPHEVWTVKASRDGVAVCKVFVSSDRDEVEHYVFNSEAAPDDIEMALRLEVSVEGVLDAAMFMRVSRETGAVSDLRSVPTFENVMSPTGDRFERLLLDWANDGVRHQLAAAVTELTSHPCSEHVFDTMGWGFPQPDFEVLALRRLLVLKELAATGSGGFDAGSMVLDGVLESLTEAALGRSGLNPFAANSVFDVEVAAAVQRLSSLGAVGLEKLTLAASRRLVEVTACADKRAAWAYAGECFQVEAVLVLLGLVQEHDVGWVLRFVRGLDVRLVDVYGGMVADAVQSMLDGGSM